MEEGGGEERTIIGLGFPKVIHNLCSQTKQDTSTTSPQDLSTQITAEALQPVFNKGLVGWLLLF